MAHDPIVIALQPDEDHYPASVSAAYGSRAPVLYAKGNVDLLARPGLGFCGSRKASEKGLATAADCAEQAASVGYSVISGNAAGVDSAAHRAALAQGGNTILVLPEGIDHFRIRKDLKGVWDWDRALAISQFDPKAVWLASRAMSRNELIIALSRAMIVIEAGSNGGTLDAGKKSLASGKPLFVAVYEEMEQRAPGNADLLSRGAHRLAKSRTTGRAKFDQVRHVLDGAELPRTERQLMLL